jgi:signal transduction histidine kinase
LCAVLVLAVVGARAGQGNGAKSPPVRVLEPYVTLTNWMGPWIWASNTFDFQTCQLWRAFEIPDGSAVAYARLVVTGDDEFTLFLDGRELGRGVDWHELFVFDLAPILKPGRHVLAIRAFNAAFEAGVTMGMRVRLLDGREVDVKSDESWRVVPNSVKHWQTKLQPGADWPRATIEGQLAESPRSNWPENVVGMATLEPVTVAFWQTGWFQITLLTVCVLVTLFSLQLMAQLALQHKERWLLQQERTRIAREIHDDIGSRMTQLVLQGEVAQCGLAEGSKPRQQVGQICEDARKLLATMDEILWAVNPQRDTLRDFTSYVCKYAEECLKSTPIQCRFDVAEEAAPAVFNLPLRRSLFMAIKEALNNAVKYSEASELHLEIHWRDQRLVVVVQDNGKGFDPAAVNPERNGLTNLRQRMNELGGTFRVTSSPGHGCRVEFDVPVEQPRNTLPTWLRRGLLLGRAGDKTSS